MAAKPGSSATILAVGVELLGVGLLTVLAGASDEAGNVVLIFMIGLWLIWMISDAGVVTGIGNALQNVASQAS
jgi:hypothetical protein